jgi:hypothetical protein
MATPALAYVYKRSLGGPAIAPPQEITHWTLDFCYNSEDE